MHKFSIVLNGLTDDKGNAKQIANPTAAQLLRTTFLKLTPAQKYENTGTEVASGEAVKQSSTIIQ